MSIRSVTASQRLDSRGKPTVQVHLTTSNGTFSSLVPSGASKGDYEAVELRDGDESLYQGNSVLKAIHNVQEILGPAVIKSGLDPGTELQKIDAIIIDLDGTENKSNLGANAILGIIMAATRAGAAAKRLALYDFIAQESGMSSGSTPHARPLFQRPERRRPFRQHHGVSRIHDRLSRSKVNHRSRPICSRNLCLTQDCHHIKVWQGSDRHWRRRWLRSAHLSPARGARLAQHRD